jgi:hypothetical protein
MIDLHGRIGRATVAAVVYLNECTVAALFALIERRGVDLHAAAVVACQRTPLTWCSMRSEGSRMTVQPQPTMSMKADNLNPPIDIE